MSKHKTMNIIVKHHMRDSLLQ